MSENAERLDTLIEWWGKDKADKLVEELFSTLTDEQKNQLAMKIAEASVTRIAQSFAGERLVESVVRDHVRRVFEESMAPQIEKMREHVEALTKRFIGEKFPTIVSGILEEMTKKATQAAVDIVSKALPSRY